MSDKPTPQQLPEDVAFGQDIYEAIYAQKEEEWGVSTSLTLRVARALIEQGYRKQSEAGNGNL